MQNWNKEAKQLLRAEMVRQGLSYGDMVEKLASIGVIETDANLRNKISRASFSAGFMLQCLKAMGVDTLRLN
jgi:hypothetical protein